MNLVYSFLRPAMPPGALFSIPTTPLLRLAQLIDQLRYQRQPRGTELFQRRIRCVQVLRLFVGRVKKFGGRDVEVFANIEKVLHLRERPPVFNPVDVARILPQGQAHFARGDLFLTAQLRQAQRKKLLVLHQIPPDIAIWDII